MKTELQQIENSAKRSIDNDYDIETCNPLLSLNKPRVECTTSLTELGGGGVVVNQTINVTTGVQQTVRAEIANLLPQISNAAKSAVADARMRGGGFSKAMVGA